MLHLDVYVGYNKLRQTMIGDNMMGCLASCGNQLAASIRQLTRSKLQFAQVFTFCNVPPVRMTLNSKAKLYFWTRRQIAVSAHFNSATVRHVSLASDTFFFRQRLISKDRTFFKRFLNFVNTAVYVLQHYFHNVYR